MNDRPNLTRYLWLFLLLAVLPLGGCLHDIVDDATTESRDWRTELSNSINDTVDGLNNQSAQWQDLITNLRESVADDVQSTIRVEIDRLAQRAIAGASLEVKCNADFIADRLVQGLDRILAMIWEEDVPEREPSICNVIDPAVERTMVPDRVNRVEFFGYDFDADGSLQAFHEDASGQHNVTNMLDYPNHYLATLKFGANGIQLNDSSNRLLLKWQGSTISTVAIIQAQPRVCEAQIKNIASQTTTFMPPHVTGDKDFYGNGPEVDVWASRTHNTRQVTSLVYMKARENKSDWTKSRGSKSFALYTAPQGWEITGVSGDSFTDHSYEDNDHATDSFSMGAGEFVKRFDIVGDTNGDEAGSKTQVTVVYNPFTVEITENKDCVSADAVERLRIRDLIQDNTYQRLLPKVNLIKARRRAIPTNPD